MSAAAVPGPAARCAGAALTGAACHRSVACFKLEEYETARESFAKAQELAPTNAALKTWIRKCDAEIQGAPPSAPAGGPRRLQAGQPPCPPCARRLA